MLKKIIFQKNMQTFLIKQKNIVLSLILLFTTFLILLCKIGFLVKFGIFNNPKIYYLLFFGEILFLVFLKWKNLISGKSFLIITFPTFLFLFWIINNKKFDTLHYLFDLIIGIWLISTGLFAVKKISEVKCTNSNFKEEKNLEKNKKIFSKISLTFLFLIILTHSFFAFYHSNKALYVDERLWTYSSEKRIQDFWTNILERDWRNVRVSDKPGVTLTWISGISLFWTKPAEFKNIGNFDEQGHKDFERMLFLVRLPVIIFTSLSLIAIYFFISKLFNYKVGLISTALIGLSSLLIGISRLINPDALSWIFIPLTIFSYFIYQKNNEKKYLYFTGILFGLSLLTKYIANLLIPFFLAEIFIQAILFDVKKENLPQFLKKKFLDFLAIFILGVITFYLLYPGVWVELRRLLLATLWSQPFEPIWKPFIAFLMLLAFDIFVLKTKILTYFLAILKKLKNIIIIFIPVIFAVSIIFVLVNVYLGMKPLNFEYFMSSPKTAGDGNYFATYFSGFYGLIFGVCPLVLLGILTGLFFDFKDFAKNLKNKTSSIKFEKYISWQLLFFIFIYFLASTFSGVVPMPRYQIIVYPLGILIGGLGIYEIFSRKKLNNKIFFGFLGLVIFVNMFVLKEIKPFYFSYSSPLLPKKYIINPKDLGEGNYEVAEYLNSLPNAKNLNVWSDRNGICDLFIGKCSSKFEYDFYIISSGREYRKNKLANENQTKNTEKIEKEFILGGRPSNFIRIIKK